MRDFFGEITSDLRLRRPIAGSLLEIAKPCVKPETEERGVESVIQVKIVATFRGLSSNETTPTGQLHTELQTGLADS